MYIHLPPTLHCKECGSTENEIYTEKSVLRASETEYRRCKSCGHKKALSTTNRIGHHDHGRTSLSYNNRPFNRSPEKF